MIKSNNLVHMTPEARAFFTFAISEQNFAFAKFSLLLGQVTSTLGVKIIQLACLPRRYGVV